MLPLMKPTSTKVHHCHEQDCNKCNSNELEKTQSISFTVWTKSLVLSCKGFTVIGSDGSLVYRVDNYSARPHHVILMDASGNPIFTICRRKRLRMIDSYWLIYEGEVGKNSSINSSKKPIFYVRRNMSIMKTKLSVLAYVYGSMFKKGSIKYTIEGSYAHRSCKIMDESRRACSEMKKKKALKGGDASFGVEVFDLIV